MPRRRGTAGVHAGTLTEMYRGFSFGMAFDAARELGGYFGQRALPDVSRRMSIPAKGRPLL